MHQGHMAFAARLAGRALPGVRSVLAHLRGDRARPAWHRSPHSQPAPLLPARQPIQVGEIRFRRLVTPADIAGVLPLRREINLPQAGDASFAALEKKETSAALSAPSSGVDKS
jgi:hypothetical protein